DRPKCGEDTRIFLYRIMELTMGAIIKPDSLHRTAKYFMDNGRADTHEDSMALLKAFGLTVCVGQEIAGSVHQQTALLTLINAARRTLLGGIDVIGLPNAPSLTPLARGRPLAEAVRDYGGHVAVEARREWPSALIGEAKVLSSKKPCWRLTWDGWR